MDQLLQIRNLKNRFNITETRVTNCGAKVYLGVFPKDELERTDFVEFDSPKNSAVSDLSKGYLLTVDKPNFTRWHTRKNDFIGCLQKYGDKILYCRQCVGDTVYLPYGWLRCVITVNIHSVCASLLSVGFKIPKKRREDVWKVMTSAIAVEGSTDKKKKGPVSCLNQ